MGKSKQLATMLSDAPAALDTLDELAAALGDDANFATTVTNSIATKAPLADPQFTGNVGISVASPTRKLELNNGGTGNLVTFTDGVATNFTFKTDSNSVGTFGTEAGSTKLAFMVAGSEKVRIDDGGRIGIGTTPNSNISASTFPGNISLGEQGVLLGNATSTQIGHNFYWSGSAFKYLGSGKASRIYQQSGEIVFQTTDDLGATDNNLTTMDTRLTINSVGNVGIGTGSPQFKLHVNKQTDNYAPTNGVDENVVAFQDAYDAGGSHILTFSNLDGNWVDGTSGADSAFGWLWGYQNKVRGGLVYDHRGSERMQMWASYGAIGLMTADAADDDAVPTDSNINERITILPGGKVGINNTAPVGHVDIVVPQDRVPLVVRSGGKSATGFNATHVMHCYNSIGSSGVWYDVCYVSHSPNIFILGGTLQDNNTALGGARYCSRMYGTYGSVVNTTFAGGLRTTAMNGGVVTGMDYRYLNSGGASGSYRLQVQVTWSGGISTMEVFTTVTGHGADTFQEDN